MAGTQHLPDFFELKGLQHYLSIIHLAQIKIYHKVGLENLIGTPFAQFVDLDWKRFPSNHKTSGQVYMGKEKH